MGKFHEDPNEVMPTAAQEKAAMQSDYRRDLIEPWDIIDRMLADMINAANRYDVDSKPIYDLANHADDVWAQLRGDND